MNRSLCPLLIIVAAQLTLAAVTAQSGKDVPSRELELDGKVTYVLCQFARTAETNKLPSRARRVYEQVLEHYERDNKAALTALGFRFKDGAWQAPDPATQLPADSATPQQARTVADAWSKTSKRAAQLHRELGVALLGEGEEPRGRAQLERALVFDPEDLAVHKALGHGEIDGFFGNDEQLAFVRRMREIAAAARTCAEQEHEVKDLDPNQMPSLLQTTGLPFAGARSKHFTYWVVDSPEAARMHAIWSERAMSLLKTLLGERSDEFVVAPRLQWQCVVRTDEQRDSMLQKIPEMRAEYSLEEAKVFGGLQFSTRSGKAVWVVHEEHADADSAVGGTTLRSRKVGYNAALTEGLVYSMTWLLCGTTMTHFGFLPKTYSGPPLLTASDPDGWLKRLRDDIDAGTDWPLVQVPRERLDNFRDSVRVKVWSFMLWLIARHEQEWPVLLQELAKPNMMPEDVAATFEKVLGRSIDDVEEEWRVWARRGSYIGKASGMGR